MPRNVKVAPPPPPVAPYTMPNRLGQKAGDRQTARGDRDTAQALGLMREIWAATRGYFPGRDMPVPRFTRGKETVGAVGWYPGRDGPTPIGVRFDRSLIAQLLGRDHGIRLHKRASQEVFSSAVETLLHEWAHNFQKPQNYSDRDLIEGGAEAFAQAVAPVVMRRLGRRYRRGTPYYPTRVVTDRGMPFIVRDQFAAP